MKILHVISTLSPRFGGPSAAVSDLARHQALAGLNVTIFTTNSEYPRGTLNVPVNRPCMVDGVRCFYFSVQYQPLQFSLPMAFMLKKVLNTFDVVHIHGLYRFPVSYAALLSRIHRRPYIIRPHGSLDPFLYKQSSKSLFAKRIYEKLFDLPNLNAADAIHFSSAKEKSKTAFLALRAPARVVSGGIDLRRFDQLPAAGKMRKRLGLKNQSMILFLGRINFKKGLDLLVKAFSKVSAHMSNAVLVIAGPDNDGYAEVVSKMIAKSNLADKVIWQEMLNRKEVLEAYVDADVFVLPSYSENFGIAVVEAMACGLPVVVSNQVDIWTEVSESGAGIVTELDSHQIAESILAILADRSFALNLGDNGRKLAENRFSYDRISMDVTLMYKEVIKSHVAKQKITSSDKS